MTERENYLNTLHGMQPEWVPNLPDAADVLPPFFSVSYMATEEKIDYLGVHWLLEDNGPMPDTSSFVMDDVTKWRDYVHYPDPADFDWEMGVKIDLEHHDPNKALVLMAGNGGGCFFIPLMNMMGFSNGLCALYEEPEAVEELFDSLCSYLEKCIPYYAKYYKPDVMVIGDDICTARGPFISYDTYEELLKPFYQRLINAIKAEGIWPELHMCGKCEPFVEDFVSMGIHSWQPAQPLNDLGKLKEKYGNQLIFDGAWFTGGPGGVPDAPEEIVRQEVRDSMDQLAKGGGYIFWSGGAVGSSPDMLRKMEWLDDEARKYGHTFYK